jgi:hypothetical protein
MRWFLAGLLAFALTLLSLRASAQAQTAIRITAPASGETLSGLVNVMGTSAADGFASAELSFAYASDSTSTWFLIYQTASPVTDGLLAAWGTSLVTDGDYHLRLRVILQDGSILESLVTGLRNQLPTETPTPTVTPEPTATTEFIPPPTSIPPTPQPAPTSTRLPTPTPLPPNPITLSESQIYAFLGRAILATLLVFIVVAILLRLRRG